MLLFLQHFHVSWLRGSVNILPLSLCPFWLIICQSKQKSWIMGYHQLSTPTDKCLWTWLTYCLCLNSHHCPGKYHHQYDQCTQLSNIIMLMFSCYLPNSLVFILNVVTLNNGNTYPSLHSFNILFLFSQSDPVSRGSPYYPFSWYHINLLTFRYHNHPPQE